MTNETSYHLRKLDCGQKISYMCFELLRYPYVEYRTDSALPQTFGKFGFYLSPGRKGWCGERAPGLATTQMCQSNIIPNSKKRK